MGQVLGQLAFGIAFAALVVGKYVVEGAAGIIKQEIVYRMRKKNQEEDTNSNE